jgi:hypothetical protein
MSGLGAPQAGIYNAGPPSFLPTTILGLGLPGAVGENQANDVTYRFYDRVAKIGNPGNGNTIYAYHGNQIFGYTAPPNWSVVHTTVSQGTAYNSGAHTGLYVVDAEDGSASYLVGFYRTTTTGIGYVKMDLSTGVWSSGVDTSKPSPSGPCSTCAAYKGRLAMASNGTLHLFDPLTNTFTAVSYASAFGTPNSQYAKVRVANGRLFIIDSAGFGPPTITVGEYVFGGIVNQWVAPDGRQNPEAWTLFITPKALWVMYDQTFTGPGGTGIRLFQWNITSIPGDPIGVPFDAAALVDVASAPGGADQSASEWAFGCDNGHVATPGAPFPSRLGFGYDLDNLGGGSIFNTAQGIESVGNTPWVRRIGAPQPLPTWSRVASPNGTSEHLAPNSFPQIESFEGYSDGTVSRGVLVKFRMYTAGGSFPQLHFLYGTGLDPVGGTLATLSVGDGITIGGAMTLNVPGKYLNTGSPVENGNTQYQIIWDLDADGVGSGTWVILRTVGFTVGFDVAGLLNPGPAQQLNTAMAEDLPGDNPTSTAGSVRETSTLTDASPSLTGGSVRETVMLTLGNPSATAGPVRETTAGGDYPGNISARVPARAHSEPGWINFQTDGVGVGGDQPTANLLDSASDPTEPRGSQAGAPASGDVKAVASLELGALDQVGALVTTPGTDLTAPADTVLVTVPAGFEYVIFGASVRCEAATAISIPGTAGIGFNGAADNLFSSQLMTSLTAQDDAYDYPVGGESVVAPAGSVISFGVDTGATGASQTGEVILFGYARRV